jgi:predicted Zn finger-like uncharacterized protein
MDVSCPACSARYTANDEKLRGKTARMRCKGCDHVWLVSGPSVEPRLAAVVKKGAEREKRDLFADADHDLGVVKQTVPPPPSTGFTAVGARNENSVLFSLDQLTKTALLDKAPETKKLPAPPQQMPSFRPSDDEGMIDLKALSTAPPPPRPVAMPIAPLFSEPPMAFDVNPQSSKVSFAKSFSTGQLIAGVAAATAFVLIAVFGIALTFRGEEPVKHAAKIEPPPVVAAAPPPKVEAPPAPAASTASNDADPQSDASEGPKKGKGKKGRGGGARSSKGANASAMTSTAPKPKPIKAADPCHCKGNFDCILACTAKR